MFKHRTKIRLLISINVDSPALLFSMLFRIPCIVYYHYNTAFQVRYINKRSTIGLFLQVIERFAFKNATAVWVTSPSLAAKVKLLGAKRVRMIPNWVDTKEIERIKTSRRRPSGFCVLFVGRLHRVKQVDLLIRAFRLIQEKNSKTSLYILGDGEQRKTLVKLTRDLGLSGSVHFRGYVDQATVLKMMKSSDVLVLPSKIEGNPRVLIEAMVTRLPIVATKVPGIEDMVQHLKTGYLIDCQKPENLAYAIEYVIRNKEESTSMVEHAYTFAYKNFSKEKVSQKIRDELKSILSK
jgi:glycosyltransferase involved in cell wall biosynthesis